ncbi:MAG: hypothetical protein LBT56_02380 [Prevotellaceae bacterium]|nr:hypothetical protein [Prevotellaceae bacterium]
MQKILLFRQLPLSVVMPQAALALTCGYEDIAHSGKTLRNRLNCDFNRFCPLRALRKIFANFAVKNKKTIKNIRINVGSTYNDSANEVESRLNLLHY